MLDLGLLFLEATRQQSMSQWHQSRDRAAADSKQELKSSIQSGEDTGPCEIVHDERGFWEGIEGGLQAE